MQNFIMVIYPSPTVRKILELILQQAGYRGVSFAHGRIALTWLENHPDIQPAFVLLDMQMPDIDGYEWARCIKNNPRFHHTTVALLSGESVDQTKLQAVGITTFIKKPFTTQGILTTVQMHVLPTAHI